MPTGWVAGPVIGRNGLALSEGRGTQDVHGAVERAHGGIDGSVEATEPVFYFISIMLSYFAT